MLFAPSRGADESAGPVYVPYNPSGIYALGETVGWHVTLPWNAQAASYVIRKNNLDEIGRGTLVPASPRTSKRSSTSPAWCTSKSPRTAPGAKPKALGAAVAPEKIGAVDSGAEGLRCVLGGEDQGAAQGPGEARAHGEAQREGRRRLRHPRMDHLDGKHVWAQVAKPHDATGKKKYPGLVILQWASPPYPLQKSWVTDRAAEGWLAVNVEPHDVMPDQPKDVLRRAAGGAQALQQHRDPQPRQELLPLYVPRRHPRRGLPRRAARTGTARRWWSWARAWADSKACAPRACIRKSRTCSINVPAGADANGNAHGRKIGYPFWDVNDPKVLETAQYFDTVNCAARIKVPSLVAMGFIDTVTPPVGIWAAFNQIQAPKEAAPMIDSPHNHLATPEQSKPWNDASARWLGALVAGQLARSSRADVADAAHRREFDDRRTSSCSPSAPPGKIDVYFVGDSITRRWGTSDAQYADLLATGSRTSPAGTPRTSAGAPTRRSTCCGACRTASSTACNPKIVVVMAGTNNVGKRSRRSGRA